MAVSLQANKRAITNVDYAHNSQFRFVITKLPTVEYFITAVNLPQISLSGGAEISTPFKEVAFGGDTVIYEDLTIEFLVDEDLKNWLEINDWIKGIGFPRTRDQFATELSNSVQFPNSIYSDATLVILTNKNNPNLQVTFENIFPTQLSGLQFTTQGTDTEVLRATANFTFTNTVFERL